MAIWCGVAVGHRQTRRYLGLPKAGYRRTSQTVGRRQDPEKVGRAGLVLEGQEKGAEPTGNGFRPKVTRDYG